MRRGEVPCTSKRAVSTDNGHPPITPPAFVRQLEQNQHELYSDQQSLRQMSVAMHMATTEQLGLIAGEVRTNTADISEIKESMKTLEEVKSLLKQLVERK